MSSVNRSRASAPIGTAAPGWGSGREPRPHREGTGAQYDRRVCAPGMKVLDAAAETECCDRNARRFQVDITAIDYAADMVGAASQTAATEPLVGTIQFREGDVTNLHGLPRDFDLIYTERVIINLPDWKLRREQSPNWPDCSEWACVRDGRK